MSGVRARVPQVVLVLVAAAAILAWVGLTPARAASRTIAPGCAVVRQTAWRTERGMVFDGVVSGCDRVVLRASQRPLTGQTGWYLSVTPRSSGSVRIELTRFPAGVRHYWQLEHGRDVIASGVVPATPAPTPTPTPTATATPTPTPTSTSTGAGSFTDATSRSFAASNGLVGRYHLYAAGLDPSVSVGLMVQFHGDGAYEFDHPDSSYSLGGATGLRAQARAHNMVLLVARTPDTTGTPTWWEAGSANADYARDLVRSVVLDRFAIDRERIWLVGYSGGAQFITQFLLPKHSSLIAGGGAVVFGGGGVPRVTAAPFAADLVPDFSMHWYTGGADDGTCDSSYNALRDAQRGSAYYAQQGFAATLETPAGVCHDLSGRFGPITGQQLDRHDS